MSYKAHKILEGLFQGGFPPAGDGLKKAGIDVLVLCALEHQNASMYPGLEVILAPGDDDRRPHRLLQFIDGWKSAAHQVAVHVRSGKKVLITCMQGLNRSGMVTALALRELTGLSGKEIVALVQKRRSNALFNDTFARYIEDSFPEKHTP
jgi:protein-tyrosine phosphatase